MRTGGWRTQRSGCSELISRWCETHVAALSSQLCWESTEQAKRNQKRGKKRRPREEEEEQGDEEATLVLSSAVKITIEAFIGS